MDISIITTTYNRKDLLKQTIESVQKSIFAPLKVKWEHIIYDDASTDGTEKLFKNNPWPNVRYIKGEKNMGQSYGKNVAIKAARGKYILIIDSDDIIVQRALYNFIRVARTNPKIQWFISDFLGVNNDLSYIIGSDYYGWPFKNIKEILQAIMRGEHYIQANAFFKRLLFIEAGGFDENDISIQTAEDIDLYIRFLLKGAQPQYVPFISHLHRFHANNLSQGITKEKHKKMIRQLKKKYKNYRAK